MGWCFMNEGPFFDERHEIERLFTWPETCGFTGEIDKLQKVGSIWFAAITFTPNVPHDPLLPGAGKYRRALLDGSYTWIAVILTKRSNGEWGYKDMSEVMGPASCYCRCPNSILNLASETTNEYALQFRERCRTWNRRPRPKAHEVWRLAEPVHIGGHEIDTVKRLGFGRMVFDTQEVGYIRLRGEHLVGAEKLS